MATTNLYHWGVKGMKWGVRRFQNEDGSLTPAGKERYTSSLSNVYDDDNDPDGDYTIKKGTSVFRRSDSGKDSDISGDTHSYVYDYDNPTDDDFYKQFGRKVSEYTVADDINLAGKRVLGKAFADKMLAIDDENDVEALDIAYYDATKRSGEQYVEGLFAMPFEPSKHRDTLEKIGGEMVARMLASQRNEAHDAKMRRRGMRDDGTALNDIGRSIIDSLSNDGYSGIRDYNDYGSAAKVTTPTVIFNPAETLQKSREWVDEILDEIG